MSWKNFDAVAFIRANTERKSDRQPHMGGTFIVKETLPPGEYRVSLWRKSRTKPTGEEDRYLSMAVEQRQDDAPRDLDKLVSPMPVEQRQDNAPRDFVAEAGNLDDLEI
jgi:hypothetical protein